MPVDDGAGEKARMGSILKSAGAILPESRKKERREEKRKKGLLDLSHKEASPRV